MSVRRTYSESLRDPDEAKEDMASMPCLSRSPVCDACAVAKSVSRVLLFLVLEVLHRVLIRLTADGVYTSFHARERRLQSDSPAESLGSAGTVLCLVTGLARV